MRGEFCSSGVKRGARGILFDRVEARREENSVQVGRSEAQGEFRSIGLKRGARILFDRVEVRREENSVRKGRSETRGEFCSQAWCK